MDGQEVPIGKAFKDYLYIEPGTQLPNGHIIDEGAAVEFDHSEWNDQGRIPQAHPNCRCRYEVHLHTEGQA